MIKAGLKLFCFIRGIEFRLTLEDLLDKIKSKSRPCKFNTVFCWEKPKNVFVGWMLLSKTYILMLGSPKINSK